MDVPKRDSMKSLKRALKLKEFSEIRDRIKVIILARKGLSISEINIKLDDYCSRWIQKWVARYREGGLDGLWDKPRSGAPKHLATEKEEAFFDRIFQCPQATDQVSIFHALAIQAILLDEFQAEYSESGVYALLKRLGLTWITSRPRHEFNDPEKMEAWKEEFKAKYKEIKKKSRQENPNMVPG